MGEPLKRNSNSLSVWVTKGLESVGVLNKGSGDLAAGDGAANEAAENLPVVSSALNVTRVSGVAALIASAGAAALALFNVDKANDPAGVVAAAYGSAGLIVAASLVAVAVILYADISARSQNAPTATATAAAKPKGEASGASDVKSQWDEALRRIETAGSGLTSATDRLDFSALWRDASGTSGMVSEVTPPVDLQDEHSRLLATQGRIIDLLKGLIDDQSTSAGDVGEIAAHIRDMRETVNNISSP